MIATSTYFSLTCTEKRKYEKYFWELELYWSPKQSGYVTAGMPNFGLHQSNSRILEISIAQGKFEILCYIEIWSVLYIHRCNKLIYFFQIHIWVTNLFSLSIEVSGIFHFHACSKYFKIRSKKNLYTSYPTDTKKMFKFANPKLFILYICV